MVAKSKTSLSLSEETKEQLRYIGKYFGGLSMTAVIAMLATQEMRSLPKPDSEYGKKVQKGAVK